MGYYLLRWKNGGITLIKMDNYHLELKKNGLKNGIIYPTKTKK